MGEAIHQFLTKILTPPSLTRQRKSQAILRLAESYGIERLEAACQRAINFDNFEYRCLETILKKSLDKIPSKDNTVYSQKLTSGVFLRNAKEFSK